jgi:hypothetical protein
MTTVLTPATPRSLTELLEHHAHAALEVSGADQSAWNGKVVEAGEGILGLAHWDGTLHLDRECILDPINEMYERAGGRHSKARLIRYREAFATLLHEQSHFLGPTGATQEAALTAFKLPGGRHLEEGVAEAWAHDHLDDYLRRLGVDQVAPGITKVRSEPSYAAFVPAVRLFTRDLDRRAGLPAGESLHLLNRQTAEGQWRTALDLIHNSTRLPELVPPDQHPAVRLRLESALRGSFKALETYEPFPRGFAASRSHSAGTRILTNLHNHLTTTESQYTPKATAPEAATPSSAPPKPAHQDPQTAYHQALSGMAPPTPTTHPKPAASAPITDPNSEATATRQRQPSPAAADAQPVSSR